jgi:hypothetical protein
MFLALVSEFKKWRAMLNFLNQLPDLINKLFDVLELLVFRLLLLALAALGAYSLIAGRH